MAEALLLVIVRRARHRLLIGAHDLIIDSVSILASRRRDSDAAVGHAPAHYPRPLLRGYRVHTLLCRGSGLRLLFLLFLLFLLSPANVHDAPFARPLLEWAIRLYGLRPCVVRLDAGYWSLRFIHWIHTGVGAVAVLPWNPKRQRNRSRLPPAWTAEKLGKRSCIERFFGRVFSLFSPFRLQRPPVCGWSAVATRVALTYAATVIVGLAAQQAGRGDLICSPTRGTAHSSSEICNALTRASRAISRSRAAGDARIERQAPSIIPSAAAQRHLGWFGSADNEQSAALWPFVLIPRLGSGCW